MLDHEQLSQGEGPTSLVGTQHTPTVIETSPQLQNISITYRKTRTRTRRIGNRIPQSNVLSSIADEDITKEMHDGLGRDTTVASSIEAEQGSGNISKTQTKATPSGLSSPRTNSEGGPGCHVTIGVVLFWLGLKGYLTCLINHHSKKGASFTQGMVSSIPIGGSISLEVVVAIVRVVIAIIGVVVVVDRVFIIKILFVIIGILCRIVFYYLIHQPMGYVDSFLESLRF
nr:hypothetical protein [Tanacetum cinerariifolium]